MSSQHSAVHQERSIQVAIDREAEIHCGKRPYLATLAEIHTIVEPKCYFEIGVQYGRSLALAKGRAIGVDPAPQLAVPLRADAQLFRTTSDDFFQTLANEVLTLPIDMAFIDGMHLFEYALRDFISVESRSSPYGLIVIDDIYPNHPLQAARVRQTRTWMGDVWRLAQCLREHRPDLFLLAIDTTPSGLLLVAGLEPHSVVLRDAYDVLVAPNAIPAALPKSVLAREDAVDPGDPRIGEVLQLLRNFKEHCQASSKLRVRLDGILSGQ